MRILVALGLGFATAGLAAGCTTSSGSAHNDISATQGFTCCRNADISTIRHPGEAMSVHWYTPTTIPALPKTTVPVSLNAYVTGPYASAAAVKLQDLKGTHTYQAPVSATTTAANTAPISTIAIPASAPAGFYNLTTSVQSGNVTQSGGSIIQIR
jgi:hypothetical protein